MSTSTADDIRVGSSPQAAERPSDSIKSRDRMKRSDRIKLRRGLTFLGMTLVLPGSAQIAAGNRRVGRIAVRIWVGLWVLFLGTGLCAVVWRSGAVSLFANPATLRFVQLAMIVLAIGWGFLLIDAWRISRPPELARRHRQAFAVLSSTVVFVVVGGLLASASIISAQRDLMAAVFAGGGDTKAKNGRFNILLMGGDAGKGRVGLRPDSMTVASVDEVTGRTVLFSLPRNLEDTPFPAASPMHRKFPSGFSCPDRSCLLNAVYTYANQHKDLYPGVQDPGVQATKEAIEGATGLTINYYVLVDMRGFQALVDAVGGIRMDINTRVPIGGGSSKISGYIEPGKNVRLDGYHALWFGRSRSDSSDYARMARQKCVMSAMLNQLDPFTVLTKFNKIASAGKQIMETDIPTSDINTLLDLALKAKSLPVSSLAFVPPLIRPGNPRFDLIQERVRAKIAAAEAADTGGKPAAEASPSRLATSGSTTSASAKGKKSAAKSSKPPTTGPETDDLTGICLAR